MALTATASKATRTDIIRSLGMSKPVQIIKSPHQQNIVLSVKAKEGEIEDAFKYLVEELRRNALVQTKPLCFVVHIRTAVTLSFL
jgi:ATP-dependent DNA helicase RecQ